MSNESSAPRVTRSRIFYFVFVFSTIVLVTNGLSFVTLDFFWKLPLFGLWLAVSSVLCLMFSFSTVCGMFLANVWVRTAYRISAYWLGFLSCFVCAAGAIWIVFPATQHFPTKIPPHILAAVFFGGALVASLYGFINAATLRVTRVIVKLPNLSPWWHGRELVLVTDVHLGNIWRAGATRRLVACLEKLPCEAILLGGDLFDGPKADLDELLGPWKDYSGKAKIFYVSGNHEEYPGRAKFLDAASRVGIFILHNQKIELDGLQIVGVHDREMHDAEEYGKILHGTKIDTQRASILLAHEPINLAVPEAAGISLQLSGHTHGGQFLPWTFMARRVHKRFVHGLNRLGNLLVYTSYGAGTWGAPMRLGTKSEIVLIRLEAVNA